MTIGPRVDNAVLLAKQPDGGKILEFVCEPHVFFCRMSFDNIGVDIESEYDVRLRSMTLTAKTLVYGLKREGVVEQVPASWWQHLKMSINAVTGLRLPVRTVDLHLRAFALFPDMPVGTQFFTEQVEGQRHPTNRKYDPRTGRLV